MAEVEINFASARLRDLLDEGLDRLVAAEAMQIRKRMDEMKGYLDDADWRKGDEDAVRWVTRARTLAYRIEDEVDSYQRPILLSKPAILFILLPFYYFPLPFPESLVLEFGPVFLWWLNSSYRRWSFQGRLKAISKKFSSLLDEMDQLSFRFKPRETPIHHTVTASSTIANLIGMKDIDANRLKELLEDAVQDRVAIFITGDSGTGKTTLAATVYEETKAHFDCHAWVFLNHPFHKKDILKEIFKGFSQSCSESAPSIEDKTSKMDEQGLTNLIFSYLDGKSYLLVLDDVRYRQTWDELLPALPRQHKDKIVLTTEARLRHMDTHDEEEEDNSNGIHSQRLPTISFPDGDLHARSVSSETLDGPSALYHLQLTEHMETQPTSAYVLILRGLSDEDSKGLFFTRALPGREEPVPHDLVTIGQEIISMCSRGLPIIIATVGSLLSTKEANKREWNNFLDLFRRFWFPGSTEDLALTLLDANLSFIYADLSPVLKQCFLYCGIFPVNYMISCRRLVRLWVAEGFVDEIPGLTKEEVAREQLDQLIARNMLQVVRKRLNGEVQTCRMLNLMREFARKISSKINFCTVVQNCPSEDQELKWENLRRVSTEDVANFVNPSKFLTAHRLRSLLFFGSVDSQHSTVLNSNMRIPILNLSLHIPDNVRSYLPLWITRKLPFSLMHSFPVTFVMLRVLELQGLPIRTLPSEVGDLILLRYLGLRKTDISSLPKSLRRLTKLETLDIKQTNVKLLTDLYYFKSLRHLFITKEVDFTGGVMWVSGLQTLAGAKVTENLCPQLGHLTELRKLSLSIAQGILSRVLCSSINKMALLISLDIECDSEHPIDLHLEGKTHFVHLNKLKLRGQMGNFLNWVSSLQSLCYLYLWDSQLSEDPLSKLKHLDKLLVLSLCNVDVGTEMSCDEGSFPRLKKLSVIGSTDLQRLNIMEGAMPKLEHMLFSQCPHLGEPPASIQHLPDFTTMQVTAMPTEFEDRALDLSTKGKGFKVRIHRAAL